MTGQPLRIPVQGITCSSCATRIIRALRRLDGVTRVRVDLRHDTVSLTRQPDVATDAAITHALIAAGYRPDLTGPNLSTPTTTNHTMGEQE